MTEVAIAISIGSHVPMQPGGVHGPGGSGGSNLPPDPAQDHLLIAPGDYLLIDNDSPTPGRLKV